MGNFKNTSSILPKTEGISILSVNNKYLIYGNSYMGLYKGTVVKRSEFKDPVFDKIPKSRNPLEIFKNVLRNTMGSWEDFDSLPLNIVNDFFIDIFGEHPKVIGYNYKTGRYPVNDDFSILILHNPFKIIICKSYLGVDDSALDITDLYEAVTPSGLEDFATVFIDTINTYFGLNDNCDVATKIVYKLKQLSNSGDKIDINKSKSFE